MTTNTLALDAESFDSRGKAAAEKRAGAVLQKTFDAYAAAIAEAVRGEAPARDYVRARLCAFWFDIDGYDSLSDESKARCDQLTDWIISGSWRAEAVLSAEPATPVIPLLTIDRLADWNYAVFCEGIDGALALGDTAEDAVKSLVQKALAYHAASPSAAGSVTAEQREAVVTEPNQLPPYRRKHGGLFRCCLASLDNQMTDSTKNPPKEGDILDCEYEPAGNKKLRFRDGYWEWNHDFVAAPRTPGEN